MCKCQNFPCVTASGPALTTQEHPLLSHYLPLLCFPLERLAPLHLFLLTCSLLVPTLVGEHELQESRDSALFVAQSLVAGTGPGSQQMLNGGFVNE